MTDTSQRDPDGEMPIGAPQDSGESEPVDAAAEDEQAGAAAEDEPIDTVETEPEAEQMDAFAEADAAEAEPVAPILEEDPPDTIEAAPEDVAAIEAQPVDTVAEAKPEEAASADTVPAKPTVKRRYTFLQPDEEEEEARKAPAEAVAKIETGEQTVGYHVYSSNSALDEAQLYSFRIKPAPAQDAAAASPGAVAQNPGASKAGAAARKPVAGKKHAKSLDYLTIGLGVVLIVVVAVGIWSISKKPAPPIDLGEDVFAAAGLRGHLIVKGGAKPEYKLHIEPLGMQQRDGFVATVSAPLQPISVNFQLKDSSGFVVCTKHVLLKFDPGIAAALADASRGSSSKVASSEADEAVPATNLQDLQVQEMSRERGNDLFQNAISKDDGQISAIDAQGALSCDAKSFERVDYWDFSTNFPTLEEQDELIKDQAYLVAHASGSDAKPHAEATGNAPATQKNLAAALEGDDVITGYAPSNGTMETSGGRVFIVDRGGLHGHATGWQVFPAAIHYKCNKSAACIITRSGVSTALYARLRR